MRKLVALGCCAFDLAFSLVAGTAHVHRAAGHHDEMRGLHLDHAHIGHATDHDAEAADPLRGPPGSGPPPARAPPA